MLFLFALTALQGQTLVSLGSALGDSAQVRQAAAGPEPDTPAVNRAAEAVMASLPERSDTLKSDIPQHVMDDRVVRMNDSIAALEEQDLRPQFHPDPQKALWLAFTFPGLGQIYNRKYWKLPIVYGLGVGVGYAIGYTNTRYKRYMVGYQNFNSAHPDPALYQSLVPKGYPESSISTYLKNQMDSYRRTRDIAIVAAVAVYALTIIDAFVDAQLSDFDISPDLTMKVKPTVQEDHEQKPAVGVGMQVKF